MLRLRDAAAGIVEKAAEIIPEAAIQIEVVNTYPGLDTPNTSEAVAFVKSLTGANGTIKVAFGTEGGLFDQQLGIPTVICGPGSMAQGHKPNEYVAVEQIRRCDQDAGSRCYRISCGALEQFQEKWKPVFRPELRIADVSPARWRRYPVARSNPNPCSPTNRRQCSMNDWIVCVRCSAFGSATPMVSGRRSPPSETNDRGLPSGDSVFNGRILAIP